MIAKLLRRLVHPATKVPDEIAVCEFDCRRTECLHGDWAKCERRLGKQAPQQQGQDIRTG
ncbi:MAG: hypothetical protein HKP57_07250 [Halobacteria archaeon]|nr:hypothetical protein [Halobacteria archaeon]